MVTIGGYEIKKYEVTLYTDTTQTFVFHTEEAMLEFCNEHQNDNFIAEKILAALMFEDYTLPRTHLLHPLWSRLVVEPFVCPGAVKCF